MGLSQVRDETLVVPIDPSLTIKDLLEEVISYVSVFSLILV